MFKNQQGQSLIELIVAVAVISVGLFGVWMLFLANFSGEGEARMRSVGANLAREGLEIVKNIRDSNWLHFESNQPCEIDSLCRWDSGLAVGLFVVDDIFVERPRLVAIDSVNDQKTRLFRDEYGFYNYQNNDFDDLTAYRRWLVLRDICCPDNNFDFKCDYSDFEVKPFGEYCSENQFKIGLEVQSHVWWRLPGRSDKIRTTIAQTQLFDWR